MATRKVKTIKSVSLFQPKDDKSYIEVLFEEEETGKLERCTVYDLYVNPVEIENSGCIIHSTDRSGKCFICKEQVFTKESTKK